MPLNSQESGVFFSVAVKIAGFFLSFVGGIVTATWAVSRKVKGFEDRVDNIEKSHVTCQVHTLGEIKASLAKIDQKLDGIPALIDERLDRTHARIDGILLKGDK